MTAASTADAASGDGAEQPDATLVGPLHVQPTADQVVGWLNRDELGRAMVTAAANGVIAEAHAAEAERRGEEIARLRAATWAAT